jgi:NCS2 family nucleobase:cation symporter-2/xanthine permease XanP
MCLGWLRQIITPAVGGTVVMLIAVSIMPIAVDLIARLPASVNSTSPHQTSAAATFVSIIVIIIFAGPRLRLWAPLIGVGLGCAVAYSEGLISFQAIGAAPWIGLPSAAWPGMDLSFGAEFWALLPAFAIVTLVGGIETYADATAVQRVALRKRKPIDFRAVQGAINADSVGNLLSGLAGTVPNTVYSTSVAVAEITGIAARRVGYFGGAFLILIAFSPKLAAVLMAIPNPVVGAYIAVLLALLFSHGLKLVNEGRPDFATGFVVTISFWIGVAMQNKWLFNAEMPSWLTTMFGSGTTSGGIVAIVLMGLLQVGKGRAVRVALTTDKAGAETLRAAVLAFCARAGWNKIATGRLAIATDETFAYIAHQAGPGRTVHLVLKRNDQFADAEFVGPNLPKNLLSDTSADEHLEAIKGLALHVEHRQFYGRDYISVQMPLPRAGDEPVPMDKTPAGVAP